MNFKRLPLTIMIFLLWLPTAHTEEVKAHGKRLILIGDSLATGALSGDTDLRISKLLENLVSRGLKDFKKTEGGINYPENSFIHVLVSKLGAKEVVNMAKIGAKVETLYSQFKDGIEKLQKPADYIIISYTANDVCGVGLFERSLREFRIDYRTKWLHGKNQRSGLIKLIEDLNPTRKVEIFVLASLDFNQAINSPSILAKKVPVSDTKTLSCEQLLPDLDGKLELPYLVRKSRDVCKSILHTSPKSQMAEHIERRHTIKEAHKNMIEVQRQIIEEVQAHLPSNIKIHFLETPGTLQFKANHVANDCFHLSSQGQGYLGMKVWEEIFERELMHSSKR